MNKENNNHIPDVGKVIENNKKWKGSKGVKPCSKCKSKNIEFDDCGYSSFNVAWGKCKDCNHEIKFNGVTCSITKDDIQRLWNNWIDENGIKKDGVEVFKKCGRLPSELLAENTKLSFERISFKSTINQLNEENQKLLEQNEELKKALQFLINVCPPIWRPVVEAKELLTKYGK